MSLFSIFLSIFRPFFFNSVNFEVEIIEGSEQECEEDILAEMPTVETSFDKKLSARHSVSFQSCTSLHVQCMFIIQIVFWCSKREITAEVYFVPISRSQILQYLGDDLVSVDGNTQVVEEDTVMRVPLSRYMMVLVPGQTVPMTVFFPMDVAQMLRVRDSNKTLGFVYQKWDPSFFKCFFRRY